MYFYIPKVFLVSLKNDEDKDKVGQDKDKVGQPKWTWSTLIPAHLLILFP